MGRNYFAYLISGLFIFSLIGCTTSNKADRYIASAEGQDMLSKINAVEVDLGNIEYDVNYKYNNSWDELAEAIFVGGRILFNGKVGLDNLNDNGKLLYKLSMQRDLLLEANLFDSGLRANAAGSRARCAENLYRYGFPRRTPEGTCYFSDDQEGNNPNKFTPGDEVFRNKEFVGSKGSRLGRNTVMSTREIQEARRNIMSPNPREVSTKLMKRKNGMIEAEVINVLAAAWLQGQNHDWFTHGRNKTPEAIARRGTRTTRQPNPMEYDFFQVPAVEGDEVFPNGLRIPRTAPDLTKYTRTSLQTTYRNDITHWWDASHIYGSDEATIRLVRTNPTTGRIYADGLIAVAEENRRLYTNERGLPITGFSDNWWVGLELIHVIFAMEHNRIARMLKRNYGADWERSHGKEKAGHIIFEKARLVNSALIAKIHTVEWTPALLFNKPLHIAMNVNWYGLKKALGNWNLPKTRDLFRNKKIMGNHAISGVTGPGTLSMYGAPFTLTEEFVSVYRMHPLVPDDLKTLDSAGQSTGAIPILETRNELSGQLLRRGNASRSNQSRNFMYSAGHYSAGALTLNNYPDFMLNMKVPRNTDGMPGLEIDMGATDIIRDRERLTPRYNEFRRKLHLKPVEKFEDLFADKQDPNIAVLKEVYDNDIEKMDLLIGTLAEGTAELRYPGYAFGNTPFYIFALMASRRLMADPFFSDYYTPTVYTPKGHCWVESADMKSVLLRHFPEMGNAVAHLKNVFRPWKKTALNLNAKPGADECVRASNRRDNRRRNNL